MDILALLSDPAAWASLAALTALEIAEIQRREAIEAQRNAEEEARLARTAKESYAGEARLLREELARATAKLLEAAGTGSAPPPPSKEKPAPQPVRVTAWMCTICGTVARQAVKDCCLKAGIVDEGPNGDFRAAPRSDMLGKMGREGGGRR